MQARRLGIRAALALGLAALFAIPAMEEAGSAGRIRTARSSLVFTSGVRARRPAGQVTITLDQRRRHREILTIALRGLAPGKSYGLYCDDPATADSTPQQFATATANRYGRARLRYDSLRGDVFPCGAKLELLAGMRVEVRDERRLLVVAGGAPVLKAAAACRFIETELFADNFDAGTTGAAPAGWVALGATVSVDEAVKEGATGKSVKIDDVDAVAEPPRISHGFTAQSEHFAVKFTLISSAANGRVGFQLGKDEVGGPVFATGFGTGLGFYEDGTIGFGIGDSLVSYTPSTAYRFRVDVDLVAKKFDVLLDDVSVVAGRDLGYAGTSLDRIFFGGATATTGTANVDTVVVIHKEEDCPPVANAGPDQSLEATGPTTPVTLNGTASADPEGAPLTYTWTGPFTGGTASGATVTVDFPLGTHVVTLVVNDGFFDSEPDTVTIVVADTTPPLLTIIGLPTSLWPPNHQLIRILPTVIAVDLVDPDPTVTLLITANESDDGLGDGSTSGDVAIVSPANFLLRAERAGPGSGRSYHLLWTATDDSGNSSSFAWIIFVPHDQGHGGYGGGQGQCGGDDDDDDDVYVQPHGGQSWFSSSGGGKGKGAGKGKGNKGGGKGKGKGHGKKH